MLLALVGNLRIFVHIRIRISPILPVARSVNDCRWVGVVEGVLLQGRLAAVG